MREQMVAGYPGHAFRPIHAASAALKGLKEQMARWSARHRARTALLSIDAITLKDIGISRAQANFDYSKPFWRD